MTETEFPFKIVFNTILICFAAVYHREILAVFGQIRQRFASSTHHPSSQYGNRPAFGPLTAELVLEHYDSGEAWALLRKYLRGNYFQEGNNHDNNRASRIANQRSVLAICTAYPSMVKTIGTTNYGYVCITPLEFLLLICRADMDTILAFCNLFQPQYTFAEWLLSTSTLPMANDKLILSPDSPIRDYEFVTDMYEYVSRLPSDVHTWSMDQWRRNAWMELMSRMESNLVAVRKFDFSLMDYVADSNDAWLALLNMIQQNRSLRSVTFYNICEKHYSSKTVEFMRTILQINRVQQMTLHFSKLSMDSLASDLAHNTALKRLVLTFVDDRSNNNNLATTLNLGAIEDALTNENTTLVDVIFLGGASSNDTELLSKIEYWTVLNRFGRGQVRNECTTRAGFVRLLERAASDTDLPPRTKQDVAYGLLHERPSLWTVRF